jgi:hypothetical protein
MPVIITRRGRELVATCPIDPALPAEGDNVYTARYGVTPPDGFTAEAYVAMIEREVALMAAHIANERTEIAAVEAEPATLSRAALVAEIAAAVEEKAGAGKAER